MQQKQIWPLAVTRSVSTARQHLLTRQDFSLSDSFNSLFRDRQHSNLLYLVVAFVKCSGSLSHSERDVCVCVVINS